MPVISISLEPAVYQLIKRQPNRSKYISELILREAYDTHKDALVERTKQALTADPEFIQAIADKVTSTPRKYSTEPVVIPTYD